MAVAATWFVGRERELSVLAELLEQLAAAGRGGAVLVEGEAGIGKSALLEIGLAGAEGRGCRVLRGYCDELTRRLPLSAMLEALERPSSPGAGSQLGRISAGSANESGFGNTSGSEDDSGSGNQSHSGRDSALSMRMAAGDPVMAEIERLLGLVDRMCAAGPVVLVIEDLHWADDATLTLWRRLARSTNQLPLLLVGSCRPVPQPPELERLRRELREHDGTVIDLAGLRAADVARLAQERLGFRPGLRLAEHLALAAGNPLYTRELLDALVRSGEVRTLSGSAELVTEEPREAVVSLAQAIADRLDFLSTEVRNTLRLAALLGPVFSVDDVSLVTALTPAALTGLLEEAITAGVLEPEGLRLRFRHGLLRQVLYETVPAPIRAALHQQVIQALIAASASAERVAELMLPVLDEATGWELDWIAANARPLADRAPEVAVRLMEHALGQTPHGDPRRDKVADALLAVAYYLGRFEQAEQISAEILASRPDPDRAGQTVWFRARNRMSRGKQPEALEAVTGALAEEHLSPRWHARLTALRATILSILGRAQETQRDAEAALAEGERLNDPYASAQAVHALAMIAETTAVKLRLMERGLDLLSGVEEGADLRLLLHGNHFGHLASSDRFEEAEPAARRALALAEQTWAARLAGLLRITFADLLFQVGRWDDAQAELELIGSERDAPQQTTTVRHAYQAMIAGHRDDRAEASRHGELSAAQTGVPASNGAHAIVLLARLLMAERAGTPEPVAEALAACLAVPDAVIFAQGEMLLPAMTRAALQLPDRKILRAVDDLRGRVVPDDDRPEAQASVAWCAGLSSGDPAPIVAALPYYRSSGRLPMLGNALEDAAVLQAAAGDLAAARATFDEATHVYAALGAVWDSRRAAGRLRAFGVRPGVRGVRRRPRQGWSALTDTELRVAALVAEGLSNPDIAVQLFLSRRTVETHVSHILAKLQLHSRRDVAGARAAAG
jgi:DNA-binding CsgD family transcriptional regulator/tetratricopeptide (TPR) repeat protein